MNVTALKKQIVLIKNNILELEKEQKTAEGALKNLHSALEKIDITSEEKSTWAFEYLETVAVVALKEGNAIQYRRYHNGNFYHEMFGKKLSRACRREIANFQNWIKQTVPFAFS